jgi:hypothetical protein
VRRSSKRASLQAAPNTATLNTPLLLCGFAFARSHTRCCCPACLARAGLKPPELTDVPTTPSASGLSVTALMEAQKAAKVAASALSFDDVPTAVAYLRQALAALGAAER